VQTKVIYLLWRVWHHRNNVTHGDGKASISVSTQLFVNYHTSFAAVSLGGKDSGHISSWSAPSEGTIKANVDAS
jgi:hypothetical protein